MHCCGRCSAHTWRYVSLTKVSGECAYDCFGDCLDVGLNPTRVFFVVMECGFHDDRGHSGLAKLGACSVGNDNRSRWVVVDSGEFIGDKLCQATTVSTCCEEIVSVAVCCARNWRGVAVDAKIDIVVARVCLRYGLVNISASWYTGVAYFISLQ